MHFRPDVESVKGNEIIFIGMIRPSSTSSRNKVGKTRREMGNQIVTVGNSEAIRDMGNNSGGEVVVTDSGRTESIELHLILADNIAHTDIQSGMGSESTTQTVTSKDDLIVFVTIEEALEIAHEVISEEISIFNIEITGGNSVVNGVETIGNSLRLKGFFGELGGSVSSTESDDDSFGAIIDKERVRNRFSAPESVGILVDKLVTLEVVTGITALHAIEIASLTIGSRGSSKEFTSKTFVIGLNGGNSDNSEDKEGDGFEAHSINK